MNAATAAALRAELMTLEARLQKGWAVIDRLILEGADFQRREDAEARWRDLERQYEAIYRQLYPERIKAFETLTGRRVV